MILIFENGAHCKKVESIIFATFWCNETILFLMLLGRLAFFTAVIANQRYVFIKLWH